MGARDPNLVPDGSYSLETAESVEVTFELAGPGSRFCALLADYAILWLIVFVLGIVTMCAGEPLLRVIDASEFEPGAAWISWVSAALIAVVTLIVFGYHAILELAMRGQTFGKRYMRIRVIRDDGTPATVQDILIRNLLRVVDFLPAMYVVGGVLSLLHPLHKRLGDLAAGTIVVKEAEVDYRASADRKPPPPPDPVALTNPQLSGAEQRLVRDFLQRRIELLPDARQKLAARLAGKLHEKHGGRLDDAESYLERLAEGRQHGT